MDDHFSGSMRLDGFIGAQIARGNRNLLIWNALLLVALVTVSWFARVYLVNFFLGPFPADDKALLAISGQTEHPWLLAYMESSRRNLIDTGFRQEMTVDNRVQSTYSFFVTPVADKWLLVLARSAADGERLVGPVYRIPEDEQRDVVGPLEQQEPALRGRVLPIMLNNTAVFRGAGYVGFAVCGPFALLALWNIARFVGRSLNPQSHPISRALARAGNSNKIAAEIDQQVASGSVELFGRVVATPSWLLWQSTFGLTIIRLDDGVWYHLRTFSQHGVKSHSIVAHLRSGKSTHIPVPGKLAPAAIQAIAQRVPWAFFGYDKQLQTGWQKERAQMIAAVDERRRQMAAQG